MKTKRIIQTALIVAALSIPCYAIKSMMFNSIDQYIERASGIWIVEVLQQTGQEPRIGPTYEGRILRVLKGEPQKESLSFCAASDQVTLGKQYLVIGFSEMSSGVWLDNGNVSPVEVPPSLSLTELDEKPVKEQMLTILTSRLTEIDRKIKNLTEEKKVIDEGIALQLRLDNLPGREE